MSDSADLFLGRADGPVTLPLQYANRHGLVSGATGTGKTVTVQIMAEAFSRAGVPVLLADVKGDLAGLGAPGAEPEKGFLHKRAAQIGLESYGPEAMPVTFWDLFGEKGHPLRATVSDMGPLLLGRLLELNDTQEGVLTLAFRLADAEALPILDLKDLRALLTHIADRRAELSATYGNIAPASVAAIQRRLLQLEDQGADHFFGEPCLDVSDFLRCTDDGRGMVNIIAADKLMLKPKLYAIFLLWFLSELFETLPEIGDPEKPIFVFFFDEAHLLFNDAPPALMERIEQVVRLIRSKGVGVYFASQNPMDIPDSVSSQLGNRVQHALRAFTPKERRVVKAAADSFRPNPAFDTLEAITTLGVGEALVSTLLSKGEPSVVERTLIRPPSSRLGALTNAERKALLAESPLGRVYDQTVDRHSAYEILSARAEAAAEAEAEAEAAPKPTRQKKRQRTGRKRMSSWEKMANQAVRTGTNVFVRELMRGVLGSFKRR